MREMLVLISVSTYSWNNISNPNVGQLMHNCTISERSESILIIKVQKKLIHALVHGHTDSASLVGLSKYIIKKLQMVQNKHCGHSVV